MDQQTSSMTGCLVHSISYKTFSDQRCSSFLFPVWEGWDIDHVSIFCLSLSVYQSVLLSATLGFLASAHDTMLFKYGETEIGSRDYKCLNKSWFSLYCIMTLCHVPFPAISYKKFLTNTVPHFLYPLWAGCLHHLPVYPSILLFCPSICLSLFSCFSTWYYAVKYGETEIAPRL